MTIEKLDMQTPDMTDANVARIAELFPNVVTEGKDESGKLVRVVDFDALKQELSGNIVEGPQERYRLDWPGKREAMLAANTPITKTLRPVREESVDFDTTQNLFVEGDNLDALKLLQETYLGKVKMIYIDPPYNTGKDFIYKDNFTGDKGEYLKETGQIDSEGGKLVANPDSNGRYHSDWLSMMYPRLKLARNLLRDDGVIFISIGQEELGTLIKLCFEVFGEFNHVTTCTRVAKTGGQKGTHFSPSVDYVLVVAKNITKLSQFREPISENVIQKVYTKVESDGPKKGEKYRAMGLYQAMLEKRPNQRFFIECPDGSMAIPPGKTIPSELVDGSQVTPLDGEGVWRWTYKRYSTEKQAGNIQFIKSDKTSLIRPDGEKSQWNVYYKIWLNDRLNDGQLPGNIFQKFQSRHSSSELKSLDIPFDFSKPSELISYFFTLVNISENDTVMDFFAGSGTLAHSAFRYCVSTNKSAKFICVQLPEKLSKNSAAFDSGFKTIADISKERIRRAGKQTLEDHPDSVSWLDAGFRVLRIDDSNMNEVYYAPTKLRQKNLLDSVEHIKPDRTAEDLLFQVMLDWAVDLSLPIMCEKVEGKTIFWVGENDLAACFDMKISEGLVKAMAAKKPLRAVFRDDGFDSDDMKINAGQLFKQMTDGHTDMKVI